MKTILKNPVIYADVPDVDVIRVGSTYYMVSTTMHLSPGCPVMKSTDLVHWEILYYLFDMLDDNDEVKLINGKNIYSKGQWASSIKEINDRFYICFACANTSSTYIFSTDDIEKGEWQRHTIPFWLHDAALFADKGKVYMVSGAGDLRIIELNEDVTGIKDGGLDRILLSAPKKNISIRCEGTRIYKIGDYYYLMTIEWPSDGNRRRRQVCYRSKEFLGEYERKVVFDDDMGYRNKGIAQGSLIDTENGEWYAMLFQDHDAVGRIPYVLPVEWVDDWPMIGVDGKAPETVEIGVEENVTGGVVASDEFDYKDNNLIKQWQWNHVPDNSKWSLTEREGYLRMTTSHLTNCVLSARNVLSQRTVGPRCKVSTAIDIEGMKDGDYAGIVALQSHFGTVGVKVEDGKAYVVSTVRDGIGGEFVVAKNEIYLRRVYLQIAFNFENSRDLASFHYSEDGVEYKQIGYNLKMLYTLDHFMGYRAGLFNYATKEVGGYVDFDFYRIEME